MQNKLLEICEFIDPGYQPVIDYETWRVAVLNYLEEIHPEHIDFMERHEETDEVFVLIRGNGILFLGEGDKQIEEIYHEVMVQGKIYNVKRSVWHTVVLSHDGSVLIVENRNTGRENSNYFPLDSDQRGFIATTARRELSDWR